MIVYLVKGHRARAYLEEVRDFLHGAAFVRGVPFRAGGR